MANYPSRPGPTSPSNNASEGNRFSKVFKFLARPLFIFCILAIVIGVGTLVTNLAAKQPEKVAAVPTTAPAMVTATAKALTATTRANLASLTPTVQPTSTPDGILKVFITGAVTRPGVYEMHEGDRIIDAVKVAGGFTEAADQDRVDQAQRVRDEMRIDIPVKAPSLPAGTLPDQNQPSVVQPVSTASPTDARLNVNTASVADLEKLPGIGGVLAQRMVDYRAKNGSFRNLDDLRKVTGLTNSVIEKIKDLIIF